MKASLILVITLVTFISESFALPIIHNDNKSLYKLHARRDQFPKQRNQRPQPRPHQPERINRLPKRAQFPQHRPLPQPNQHPDLQRFARLQKRDQKPRERQTSISSKHQPVPVQAIRPIYQNGPRGIGAGRKIARGFKESITSGNTKVVKPSEKKLIKSKKPRSKVRLGRSLRGAVGTGKQAPKATRAQNQPPVAQPLKASPPHIPASPSGTRNGAQAREKQARDIKPDQVGSVGATKPDDKLVGVNKAGGDPSSVAARPVDGHLVDVDRTSPANFQSPSTRDKPDEHSRDGVKA
eukprot:GHVU01174589.1.p1 GENE.GHVU01174589.1~~GHVU01174589.1.p1  ORF type:complete len:295 (+),score=17.78 GHVU01174589.1:74-958(+)